MRNNKENSIINIAIVVLIVLNVISIVKLVKIINKAKAPQPVGLSIVADGYYNEQGIFVEKCARITISPKK